MAKRKWTDEETQYLIKHYGKMPTREIAEHVNKQKHQIYYKTKILGLHIREEYVKQQEDKYIDQFIKKEKHLCWKCKNAVNKPVVVRIVKGKPKMVGKCPWADHLEPVKGWKTESIGIRSVQSGMNIKKKEFFKVIKCPLYEVG